MNMWLVEVIGGIALTFVSISLALILTPFVSAFWATFTIPFALGAALVISGYFRIGIHNSTPLG